ncbi:MAG: preprotein translocase subunit SecG [Gammaproteobacteria bacterium RIFCSPHIGHO2_12_FULL_41_20]|nr:MAG: preprotein translocase subunit SecG [Gammaproteobacteria bacterium RIFCSPHIGHO2_12_FULL_41_20]
MYQLILIIHVFVAVCLIALVLVQQGKGATMGAAFGSGASQTVFGSRGSGSFLLRLTIGFVVVFFVTSISLNYIVSQSYKKSAVITLPAPTQGKEVMPLPAAPTVPALPSEIPSR